MQIYRPCVNIKVFTRSSKDFNQIAGSSSLSLSLYFSVFVLLLYILGYENCGNYQYILKCSRSAVSYYSASGLFYQRRVLLARSPHVHCTLPMRIVLCPCQSPTSATSVCLLMTAGGSLSTSGHLPWGCTRLQLQYFQVLSVKATA